MTCNCGNGDTPEYYITLDGVGVDGYSPEVNVIDETSSSFKLEAVNKNNTQETPAIPKLSYLPTEYLKVDGSNADNPITINSLRIINNSGYVTLGQADLTTLNLQSRNINLVNTDSEGNQQSIIQLQDDGDVLVYAGGRLLLRGSEARPTYQQGTGTTYTLARLIDIPTVPTVGNGTITITQGGVTKGSFTTNQSGNTTINLDSGASNPLDIKNSDNTRSISLGINSDNQAYMYYNIRAEGGGFSVPVGLLYLSSDTIDFTKRSTDGLYTIEVKEMVGCDSITGGATGLVPAPSAGDENKFLKADGTWDTVGGGGSSYTEGTGIDITNDTISVDESVVMTTSNQSTINFGAKQFSHITIANGYNTGEGLYGWLDDGSSTIPLVRVSDLDDVIIGDGGSKLVLHGDETRPSYFNGQTTSYLALYSDIPDVSNFVTSTSLATTLAGYVDLTSNQTVGGNKTFTGTNYLRNTYICNASGTYFGRMRAVDNKFTFEGIGTNRSINFIPDGTGELQYNGTKVATVNDIPDVSQLQEKLTPTGGIKIEPNGTVKVYPLVNMPLSLRETETWKIYNASDTTVDGTTIWGKWDVGSVVVFSNSSTALEFGYGFYYDNGIVAMARYNGQYATLATDSSVSYQGDFYYKIQFYQDGTVKMYYSTDNSTFNLIVTTTTASGGALYGQDIYVCGGNYNTLSETYLSIPSANPVISLDPTTIQGYNSTGTLYLKLVDGVLQWTA